MFSYSQNEGGIMSFRFFPFLENTGMTVRSRKIKTEEIKND